MLIAVAAIPTANRKIFAWSGRPGAGAVGASIRSDIPLARVLLHRLSPDFVVHAYPPASWFLSLPDRRPPRGAPGRPHGLPQANVPHAVPQAEPHALPHAEPQAAPDADATPSSPRHMTPFQTLPHA